MIDEIQVENLALIRKVSMAPSEGLTVLTGETGAGKTALLTACKLLMGFGRIKARFARALTRRASRAGSSFPPRRSASWWRRAAFPSTADRVRPSTGRWLPLPSWRAR